MPARLPVPELLTPSNLSGDALVVGGVSLTEQPACARSLSLGGNAEGPISTLSGHSHRTYATPNSLILLPQRRRAKILIYAIAILIGYAGKGG